MTKMANLLKLIYQWYFNFEITCEVTKFLADHNFTFSKLCSRTINFLILIMMVLLPEYHYSQIKSIDDYKRKAGLHFHKREYKQAIKEAEQGFERTEKPDNQVIFLNLAGKSHFYLENYKQSRHAFNRMLKIAEATKDPAIFALAYHNIAEIYRVRKNWSNALEFFKKALKYYKDSNNSQGLAATYLNMGKLYRQRKNRQKAYSYFTMALEIRINRSDWPNIAIIHNELGFYYELTKDYKKSLEHYEMSEKIFIALKSFYHLGIVYDNIGRLYFVQKNHQKAKKYFKKAFLIGERLRDYRGLIIRCSHLSILYIREQNYKQAIFYIKLRIDYKKKLGYNLKEDLKYLNQLQKLAK